MKDMKVSNEVCPKCKKQDVKYIKMKYSGKVQKKYFCKCGHEWENGNDAPTSSPT